MKRKVGELNLLVRTQILAVAVQNIKYEPYCRLLF